MIRDGVKTGRGRALVESDLVGHANDGGGINATTEFGQNGTIGTEAPPDRFSKDEPKAFLVLAVVSKRDAFCLRKFPIPSSRELFILDESVARGRNRMNSDVRSTTRGGIGSEPSGDELFVQTE
jgi:hypothetical protein